MAAERDYWMLAARGADPGVAGGTAHVEHGIRARVPQLPRGPGRGDRPLADLGAGRLAQLGRRKRREQEDGPTVATIVRQVEDLAQRTTQDVASGDDGAVGLHVSSRSGRRRPGGPSGGRAAGSPPCRSCP